MANGKKGGTKKINYAKQQKRAGQHKEPVSSVRSEPTVAKPPQPVVARESLPEDGVSCRFQPLDSWFFRESRPHDAVGASELGSIFPPPVRTLLGALRTHIGDACQVDWYAYRRGEADHAKGVDLVTLMGDGDQLGALQVNGPWVVVDGKRYYPAPANLLKNGSNLQRLQIGAPVWCDLGRVALPQLPAGKVGYKTLEREWVSATGWEKILQGGLPEASEIVETQQLYQEEPRLGIALQTTQRVVKQGLLYQTRHLRLNDGVSVELGLQGVAAPLLPALQNAVLQRLGGEGRTAHIEFDRKVERLPLRPKPSAASKGVILYLITPADLAGHWLPEGFNAVERQGQRVWQGEIAGIALTIEAVVSGKVVREGGWNMQQHAPRSVESLLPAGSAWYCTLNDNSVTLEQALARLHGQQVGQQPSYGRGQLLAGVWNSNESYGSK